MGKPKRDKTSRKDEEDLINGDDEVEESADPVDSQAPAKAAVGGKKGKKGHRKKDDDWEDDIASEIASLSLDAAAEDLTNGATEAAEPVKQKKKKKTRKLKEVEDVESGEDDEEVAEKPKMKMGFGMLGDMDDSAAEDEENDSEDEEKKPSSEDEEEIVKVEETKKVDKKKSKKSKQDRKKAQTEEDDIDAILAQIESTSKPGKKGKGKKTAEPEAASQEPIVTPESAAKALDDEDVSDDDHEMKEDDGEADEGEGGSTVKTAAQKKKEKRERQKQQKLQKGKSASQKTVKPEPTKEEKVDVDAAGEDKPVATPEAGEPAPSMADQKDEGNIEEGKKGDGGEEDDKKKKKDRRKKKKGEEEEKPAKKKPPSKMVKAMQEQLRKIQEEEERLKREEEEKIRIAEEAQREREEKETVEKERKEREKQKKKEKMERLKAEGKLLTAKQKEAQKRAQQMLEAMKAQGLEIPQKVDGEKKKRVVYTKKKKTSQSQDQEPVSPSEKTPSLDRVSSVEESSEVEKAEEEEEPAPQEVEKVEEVTDSWEDVKDSWEDETEYRNKEEDAVDGADVTDSPVKVTSKDAERASETAPTREAEAEEEGSSEEESETDSSDESDEDETNARQRAEIKILQRHEEAEKKRTTDVLRAPVVVVLGHVDTGKTKLLDKLRRTNVQDGEAGGITQQIGATNVPFDAIREQTKMCKEFAKQELKIPGMLIIDTPGHESFSNLRSRGSSLCDIAILVVDIMHGLEPQTIESINLLKERKTPFIVALNKIDRLFQWQSCPHSDVLNAIKKQKPNTKLEFDERLTSVKVQFAEQGLNATLFSENKDIHDYISLVPTSAHSGDGIGNLIALICIYSQKLLATRISYSEELQATAMEVKALPGLGTTVDVILVNGILHEGDTIILAGTEGPIVTQIRGLLMPKPMKEMRVKTNFDHHKEVLAAQGVKIIAKDLEKSLAGLPVYISYSAEETEIWKEEIASALKDVLASIRLQERGVYVQASTLGSLEALLEFLRTSKIPYCGINIGPVHKKDIMKASVMLEHDSQYAVILAFDVKVERDAQEMADGLGVKIFTADIIYHLFDKFMAFREKLKKQKQEEFKFVAVFPCKVRILPQYVFNSRDPIVVGVIIETGFVKVGTPLCVPSKEFLYIGRVTSLELNHKPLEKAVKGQEVCIKIEPTSGETPKMFGRHFDHTDMLVSRISRESIDAVKQYFREEMTKTDWQLMVELKKAFEII